MRECLYEAQTLRWVRRIYFTKSNALSHLLLFL